MQALVAAMRQMIDFNEDEALAFTQMLTQKKFPRKAILSKLGLVPNEIFFIVQGLLRVAVLDNEGVEHTLHFAMENQFIADYSSFMLRQPSFYTLQALEDTQCIVLPRSAIDWGYAHLAQGQKLGRLIAEYYFIYQDNRIKNLYTRTPRQRYDAMSDIFPNIHNRVPQHMIASYLGITPVHLSRLKRKVK